MQAPGRRTRRRAGAPGTRARSLMSGYGNVIVGKLNLKKKSKKKRAREEAEAAAAAAEAAEAAARAEATARAGDPPASRAGSTPGCRR